MEEKAMRYSTSDIISSFPSNITDNILIYLPIKDAARTSLLSKGWRSNWLSISQLVFNPYYYYYRITNKTPRETCLQILQILSLLQGSLYKFVLSIPSLVQADHRFLLDQIISLVSRKDVQEFTFHAYFQDTDSDDGCVPSTLFHCTQLKRLNLFTCIINIPSEFFGFRWLVSVELHQVHISTHSFKAFISKCRLLQQLKVGISTRDDPLEMDAPNLNFLHFSCPYRSVVFKNVPLLSTLVVEEYDNIPSQISSITTMFGSLPAIKHLCACHNFLKLFSLGNSPERLPKRMLNHLQCIEVCNLHLNSWKVVRCALSLIKSSLNLKALKIKVEYRSQEYAKYVAVTPVLQLFEDLRSAEDSFDKLEQVTIEGFNGTVLPLELVKVILVKSPQLKKIIIRTLPFVSCKEKLEIALSETQFHGTLPKAEVILFDGDGSRCVMCVASLAVLLVPCLDTTSA